MKNDSKLRVVGTIEERIETILTKLNSNILVEESEMTDITNLFLPNIENLYNIVDQNKEYTLAFFSVPILDERHYYENYTCYSYILIVPKEVLPLINCTKFLAFSCEEEYENFVKKNKCLFIWNISEKKNIIRFIDNLCKSGKLLIIRKTKYVYHVRKDKKTITRLITEEPQPLGRFIQKANEEYTFEVINPNLKNVIMEMANKNINFANGENMLRREKK